MLGRAARILVSSVTLRLSSSGTLKSTRMKTRLPGKSRSVIDSFGIDVLTTERCGDAAMQRRGESQMRCLSSRLLFAAATRRRVAPSLRLLQSLFREEAYQVNNAARIAPLVVIPRQQLHQIAVEHTGVGRVEDA